MDLEDKTRFPTVAVVMALDKSCSMGGGAGSKLGISTSEVIALAAREYARDAIDLPSEPPKASIPTVSDVLRSYVDGSADPLIGPCGERYPCDYDPDDTEIVGNMEFCGACGVRVG